jgi:GNAT superfamily N-acetyltransferase
MAASSLEMNAISHKLLLDLARSPNPYHQRDLASLLDGFDWVRTWRPWAELVEVALSLESGYLRWSDDAALVFSGSLRLRVRSGCDHLVGFKCRSEDCVVLHAHRLVGVRVSKADEAGFRAVVRALLANAAEPEHCWHAGGAEAGGGVFAAVYSPARLLADPDLCGEIADIWNLGFDNPMPYLKTFDRSTRIVALFAGARVVAALSLELDTADASGVAGASGVAVHPGFRGRGLGTLLVRSAAYHLAGTPFKTLSLFAESPKMDAFYGGSCGMVMDDGDWFLSTEPAGC